MKPMLIPGESGINLSPTFYGGYWRRVGARRPVGGIGIPRMGRNRTGGEVRRNFKRNTGNHRFRNRSCLRRRVRPIFISRARNPFLESGFNICPFHISSAIARSADRGGRRRYALIRLPSLLFPFPRFRPRKKQKPESRNILPRGRKAVVHLDGRPRRVH